MSPPPERLAHILGTGRVYLSLLVAQQGGRSSTVGEVKAARVCRTHPLHAHGPQRWKVRAWSSEQSPLTWTGPPSPRPAVSPIPSRDGTRNAQTPKVNVLTSWDYSARVAKAMEADAFWASTQPDTPLSSPPYSPEFISGSALQEGLTGEMW